MNISSVLNHKICNKLIYFPKLFQENAYIAEGTGKLKHDEKLLEIRLALMCSFWGDVMRVPQESAKPTKVIAKDHILYPNVMVIL